MRLVRCQGLDHRRKVGRHRVQHRAARPAQRDDGVYQLHCAALRQALWNVRLLHDARHSVDCRIRRGGEGDGHGVVGPRAFAGCCRLLRRGRREEGLQAGDAVRGGALERAQQRRHRGVAGRRARALGVGRGVITLSRGGLGAEELLAEGGEVAGAGEEGERVDLDTLRAAAHDARQAHGVLLHEGVHLRGARR
jgi:hypothetical protein